MIIKKNGYHFVSENSTIYNYYDNFFYSFTVFNVKNNRDYVLLNIGKDNSKKLLQIQKYIKKKWI